MAKRPELQSEETTTEISQPTPLSAEARWEEISKVSAALNKQFKSVPFVRMGEKKHAPVESFSTGLATLDYEVLGCGGIPKGRVVEVSGTESSGKTTLCLHLVAQEQTRGNICCYVDAEHSLDIQYAASLGVNTDDLLVSQPDSGEEALSIVDALVRSKATSLIIVDSVAALVPRAELEGEFGESHMGLQARLMSQAMRKLIGVAEQTRTTLIFINQIREKIGVIYGSNETSPGGRALKFYSSIRLDVRRRQPIKEGDKEIGHQVEIKAVKNKTGIPKKSTMLDLYYPGESDITGFDRIGDLVAYAVHECVIEQKGAWFYYNGEKLGQGLANTKAAIHENEELRGRILAGIKEKK